MTTLYKKLSVFKQDYNHLIQESISNGEYMVCSFNMFEKYVYSPFLNLYEIYAEYGIQNWPGIPKSVFPVLNYSLKDFFNFTTSLPVEQIEKMVKNDTRLDLVFTHDIVESIEKKDFSAFRNIAKESKDDFEIFSSSINFLYLNVTLNLTNFFEKESPEDTTAYQYLKDMLIRALELMQMRIQNDDSDKNTVNEQIYTHMANAVSKAKESFPCFELIWDNFEKWFNESWGYCLFVCSYPYLLFESPDPFFSRILWHPTTITYKLKWSLAIVQLPFSARILQEDFFLNPQNKNEDEYLTSVRPEFINAGLTPLVRFMELCPLVEYNPLFYRTFVYRITGRMRPDVERLPTKILLPESAPFIYYFIKGITIDNPDCPEDIYEKMKSFFSSVDFPEDENEIPEPCDAWKNAMLELYPEIFGDGNVQISESIGEKESQDIESEDTMRQSSPEKFEKLPDDFFTDPKYLNTEYPQYRILKDSVIEKGPGILTKVINKLITENMIDDSLETVSLLMSAISGRGLKHEYTSRIVVLNGREAGYAISRIVQLLCRRADYDSLKSQFEIKFKEDERHGKQQSYLKSFSVKENKGVIIVDLIKRLYTNDRLF